MSRTITARHAAVATEQPLASLVGYDVLKKGGNAFDAAAAASFALAVTYHPLGGLGGDFFGMFYEAKTGNVHCLNASGWSPSGLDLELLRSKSSGKVPSFGPLTCMIPGLIAGVWEMHRKFGTAEFKDLIQPSLELATGGFPASDGLCRSVAGVYNSLSPEARRIFAPSGKKTRPGETIRQASLGKVISEVAESGPDAFYSSWPAEKIASTLTSLGVPCDISDFRDYKPEWVKPLSLDYRGTTVFEVPPNSMGATSLLILKRLSETRISDVGPLSKKRIELTMKAAISAYARRDEMLGDPRFNDIDMDLFMADKTKSVTPQSQIRSGDTTAFSIADGDGNIVSGIQSLFFRFGSRVFIPECGVMLNNRGSGFSTTGPNKVEHRKRPLHTLSSLILEHDGLPRLSIGTSGGDYRPLLHALFVTNAVDFGMPIEDNVSHPRFLWGGGRRLIMEGGYELPLGRSFQIQKLPMPGRTGVCQAVELRDGHKKAVCDVRGDGVPAGS